MTLYTDILFQVLIKRLQPDLVCDVGSMNARDAKRFRHVLPKARIVAFEASPHNAQLIEESGDVDDYDIQLRRQAVSNVDGTLTFNVEHFSSEKGQHLRQSISSTRKRIAGSLGRTEVEVESIRLDTFVQRLTPPPASIALWIDAEGNSYEILEGMEGIRHRVTIIHVEVETREFWHGQKLKADVVDLMASMDFVSFARGYDEFQHDVIFLAARTLTSSGVNFRLHAFRVFIVSAFAHGFELIKRKIKRTVHAIRSAVRNKRLL
ncbi:MAG: FkbM family methyltransferase [Acidobacteria bacterium]|nr:FkbM family methyltransferase [Acidobacteriota bacterium]